MKIAYFSNGESIHDQRYFDKLIRSGHEIHLISFQKDLIDLRRSYKLPDLIGIKVYNLPLPSFNASSIFLKIANIIRAAVFSKKTLRGIKPDIVCGFFIVDKYGFMAALTGFRPFLLLSGGTDILITPKKNLLRRGIIRFTLKRADIINCDAQIVKNEILELVPDYPERNIRVLLQPGINLDVFNPFAGRASVIDELCWSGKKILIMTRSLNPIYGVGYFLQALIDIVREEPDVRVILCGDGVLKSKFLQFVKEHSLEEYVYFAGHVRNEDLPAFLNAADIYVSSSLSDGTPVSLLEAMACRLPVVVTDVPAVMEWVKDGYNGFVVPRKNPVALARKIIELLKDEGLRKAMAENNYNIARESVDYNINYEKFQKLLTELTSQRARS